MSEQAKTRNVCDRVNAACFAGVFEFAQYFDGPAIELRHRCNCRIEGRLLQVIFLQSGGKHASAKRLGQQKHVVDLRADIAPHTFWIDKARDRVAELDIFIAN